MSIITGYELRQTVEYKRWRKQVLERDNHTCRECGASHKRMISHHIKPIWSHPELSFDLDNGLTVCDSCHRRIHKIEKPARAIRVKGQQPPVEIGEFCDIKQAAQYLDISVSTLKHYIYIAKAIEPQLMGHSFVFTRDQLDQFKATRLPVGRPKKSI